MVASQACVRVREATVQATGTVRAMNKEQDLVLCRVLWRPLEPLHSTRPSLSFLDSALCSEFQDHFPSPSCGLLFVCLLFGSLKQSLSVLQF